MSSKIVKGLVITSISIIVVLIISNNIKTKKKKSNYDLALILQKNGNLKDANDWVNGYEKEYLEAWVNSLNNAFDYFEYKGKRYWKQGGTAIK